MPWAKSPSCRAVLRAAGDVDSAVQKPSAIAAAPLDEQQGQSDGGEHDDAEHDGGCHRTNLSVSRSKQICYLDIHAVAEESADFARVWSVNLSRARPVVLSL